MTEERMRVSIYDLCASLEAGMKRRKWTDEQAMEILGCEPHELEAISNRTINPGRLLDMIGDAGMRVSVTFPKRASREVAKVDHHAEAKRLCLHLAGLVGMNNPRGVEPRITERWINEARLLIEKDKVPASYALEVMEWCQKDSFWKSNILSMPTFRRQFLKLEAKMVSDSQRGVRGENPAAPYLAGGRTEAPKSSWFLQGLPPNQVDVTAQGHHWEQSAVWEAGFSSVGKIKALNSPTDSEVGIIEGELG